MTPFDIVLLVVVIGLILVVLFFLPAKPGIWVPPAFPPKLSGNSELACVRIVPGGGLSCAGTQVFVGDQQIKGVTKIELAAEAGSVWKCTLHVAPDMKEDIQVSAQVTVKVP